MLGFISFSPTYELGILIDKRRTPAQKTFARQMHISSCLIMSLDPEPLLYHDERTFTA
jgi:hypothetical protein